MTRHSIAVVTIVALFAAVPAAAQTNMTNETAKAAKANCSPSDPSVVVDTRSKTYVIDNATNAAASSEAATPNANRAISPLGTTTAQFSGVAYGTYGFAAERVPSSGGWSSATTTDASSGVAAGTNGHVSL